MYLWNYIAQMMPLVPSLYKFNNIKLLNDCGWIGEDCWETYLWNLTQTNCGK